MNFLFRADASSEIGTGHVMRCIALGQAMIDAGFNVGFVTKTQNSGLLERLLKEKFVVHSIAENISIADDVQITASFAKSMKIDWIITDGYKFTTEYQKSLKQQGFKLMCIDDIAECRYVSDIILNQNLKADIHFTYICEPYTKVLLGTQYTMLRREFRIVAQWERFLKDPCRNILVTVGGGDAHNITSKIVRTLKSIRQPLFLKIVIGAAFPFITELQNSLKDYPHEFELVRDIENMVPLIQWADVAITAAGSTVWELAILQTPMIVGSVAENQVPIAKALEDAGAALNIGWFSEISEVELAEKIEIVVCSKDIREELSLAAHQIGDGKGVNRIIEELLIS